MYVYCLQFKRMCAMYKKITVNYVDVFWKLKLNEFKSSKRKSSNLCSAI